MMSAPILFCTIELRQKMITQTWSTLMIIKKTELEHIHGCLLAIILGSKDVTLLGGKLIVYMNDILFQYESEEK
jgi:hypothetical protein